MNSPPTLARKLGLLDAVVIGLGSMIGAGVFVVFAPAASVAGSALLIGLAIAGAVAMANALSSAQLAAQYPSSGGTYHYGRERLGEWPGFLAGWSFVVGKTASCAAMALVFAAYAAPAGWEKPVAVVGVLALASVNYRGVTRTARLTRVIVAVVLAVLAVVMVAGVFGAPGGGAGIGPMAGAGWYGVLQSAGLMFFAFAGYARIATLGEEVRDPARTIPRAIVIALSTTLVVYAALAAIALTVLGPESLAGSTAPLVDVVTAGGWTWASPLVRVGAALASLGALLALIAGVGRTSFAMARNGDLPRWLAAVHPSFQVPHRAELALAAVVSVVVLTMDVRGAIGFSSFGVLLYYLVANVAAFTQASPHRRYPKAAHVVGAVGCVVLAATLPLAAVLGGVAVVLLGAVARVTRTRAGS